jgi:TonB family protein
MKKPLLIIAIILFAFMAKAQTDTALDKDLNVPVQSNQTETIYSNTVFTAVQVEPAPPANFPDYLVSHLKPGQYKPGVVYVSFVVETDGRLDNFKISRSLGETEDAEVLRLMKGSPPWHPGVQNGNKVRVQYSMPIRF